MTSHQHPPHLQCDVCVVGGGPAGLTLAHALAQRGRSVVVLESGTESGHLNMATSSGDLLPPLQQTRARGLGGTATIWSTLRGGIPGGKYVELDPIDLEAHELTPWSGWPLTGVDLMPWYQVARRDAGLPSPDPALTAGTLPLLPFPADSLTTSVYHWGSAERFTDELPAALGASPLVTILNGATAIHLQTRTEAPGRVEAVQWATLSGASGLVQASAVVLATGTIENTRLLLCHYAGAGHPAPYWLGRGFMEHPIDRSLTVHSRHPALSPEPGRYAFAGRGARAHLAGRIGLSEALMREAGLRNASLRLFPIRYSTLSRQWRKLAHRLGQPPSSTYRVLLDLEQAPHPDNRITLSDIRDALGVPMVHLHWEWRDEDEAFRTSLHQVIQREFARHSCGEVQIATGPLHEHSAHHHAGTTRMHEDPTQGVVNATLRVHGHDNLFVLGASVFPTSGVANPTLTVLALSLRLADVLSRG